MLISSIGTIIGILCRVLMKEKEKTRSSENIELKIDWKNKKNVFVTLVWWCLSLFISYTSDWLYWRLKRTWVGIFLSLTDRSKIPLFKPARASLKVFISKTTMIRLNKQATLRCMLRPGSQRRAGFDSRSLMRLRGCDRFFMKSLYGVGNYSFRGAWLRVHRRLLECHQTLLKAPDLDLLKMTVQVLIAGIKTWYIGVFPRITHRLHFYVLAWITRSFIHPSSAAIGSLHFLCCL